jgi:hypothetical protein
LVKYQPGCVLPLDEEMYMETISNGITTGPQYMALKRAGVVISLNFERNNQMAALHINGIKRVSNSAVPDNMYRRQ